MITPKHKEMTSNRVKSTKVHCCDGEQKIPIAAIIQ
jgi:hypothetical protein